MEEDREEQNNELLALESILDAAQFKYERDNGFMKVDLILNDSQIELRSPDSATSSADVNRHFVEYLPPFTLSFTLPPDYPSTNPPTFTLSCSWLPRQQLYRLCLKLDEIWSNDRGSVVLYQWYDFLQNQALEHLSIKSCLEICSDRKVHLTLMCDDEEIDSNILQRAVQDIQSESEILPLLLTYNQNQLKKVFDSSLYSCEICLESKLGAQCVEIKGCKHVYCKDCLSSYFNVNISEGNVKGLNCPEPSCETPPLPSQIRELVNQELYARYEKLLLQTTLDEMADITYCPLLHCQAPVILEQNSKIAQCPACSYAFCPFCRLSYHGVTHCKVASGEIVKLCKDYKEADREKQKYMEKKYGEKVLKKAIEDGETQKWMEKNAKSCPGCSSSIEKRDGCNKMTCYKCRAYFCWLCMRLLSSSNPYNHFNDPSAPCFNKLFQGVDAGNDSDDEENEFLVYFI